MSEQEGIQGRVFGSLHALGNGKGKVRMDSLYDTDAVDLWSALTDPLRLTRWIATVSGALQVGGTFSARFTSGWEGPGVVEVCDPPRRLVVRMEPGTDDETVIEAILSPEGRLTRLVVEESGIPIDEIGAHGAGWQVHMEDLSSFLRGVDTSSWQARWVELTPTYERMTMSTE